MNEIMKLIIVGDYRIVLRLYAIALKWDHEISSAFKWQEALDAMKKKQFDLIIIGMQIPVDESIDMIKKIRADEDNLNKNAQFVFVSIDDYDKVWARCLECSDGEYLTKSIDFEKLLSTPFSS